MDVKQIQERLDFACVTADFPMFEKNMNELKQHVQQFAELLSQYNLTPEVIESATNEIINPNKLLIRACEGGNIHIVYALIKQGAISFTSGLIAACEAGHEIIARMMLNQIKFVSTIETTFFKLCRTGTVASVKLMIKLTKTLTNALEKKRNPCMIEYAFCEACAFNNMDVIRLLAQNINTKQSSFIFSLQSAFLRSCAKKSLEVIQYLLSFPDHICDINQGFFNACEGGDINIVKYLIELGANQWDRGMTCAIYRCHSDLVDLMIEHGAKNWKQCFQCALDGDNLPGMQLMLQKDPQLKNELFVVRYGNRIKIIQSLFDLGMNHKFNDDVDIFHFLNVGINPNRFIGPNVKSFVQEAHEKRTQHQRSMQQTMSRVNHKRLNFLTQQFICPFISFE